MWQDCILIAWAQQVLKHSLLDEDLSPIIAWGTSAIYSTYLIVCGNGMSQGEISFMPHIQMTIFFEVKFTQN